MILEVVGAYGRIYAAAKAIRADWNDGNDFLEVASGRYINIDDAAFIGVGWVNVRYGRNGEKVLRIRVSR